MLKTDIKDLSLDEFKDIMPGLDEKPFRAAQVFEWIYKKKADDFSGMKNLPGPLIRKLDDMFYIRMAEPAKHLRSKDGSEKFVFKLADGNLIESVVIPAKGRKTLCISTQSGCKYSCAFCASGYKGFKRDLTPGEIIGQVLYVNKLPGMDITNYVFMGMGEPLDNFDNLAKAILNMNSPKAMGIGAARLTVSTCGLVPGIKKLKDLGVKLNLSISLHAADDGLRDKLVPINKKYPVKVLVNAVLDFMKTINNKVTLEYILIKGVNDRDPDLAGLVKIARTLHAKVNLIPYSPVRHFAFRAPDRSETALFSTKLVEHGVNSTIRESKGKDINAACGQLAGDMID